MALRKGTLRKQVQMSESIAKWYEDKANEIGSSQNALMLMALKQYIDQQDAIQASKMMPEWFAKIQEIQSSREVVEEHDER
jgi:hypothetical protein